MQGEDSELLYSLSLEVSALVSLPVDVALQRLEGRGLAVSVHLPQHAGHHGGAGLVSVLRITAQVHRACSHTRFS